MTTAVLLEKDGRFFVSDVDTNHPSQRVLVEKHMNLNKMIIFVAKKNVTMNTVYRRYPIGIQNFEDLRNNNCVYVDKTELIYQLTQSNKVYFLSRPRRFGKSLLVSTLEAYFQGKKHLFEGLTMERLETEWI